jgi:hypothetical protein
LVCEHQPRPHQGGRHRGCHQHLTRDATLPTNKFTRYVLKYGYEFINGQRQRVQSGL